ncbi:MAG: HEAT repeat domain-containing protein [Syntrophaceae bacterium]
MATIENLDEAAKKNQTRPLNLALALFPARPIERTDLPRFFLAAFCGMLACIALYTVFGAIFTHAHALRMSSEMQLFLWAHLPVCVSPGDPFLTSCVHQLGSGLFFGLTLGLLCGIAGLLASIPIWYLGKDAPRLGAIGILIYGILAVMAATSSYSREMPGVSLVFGILAPGAYFLPFSAIVRTTRPREINITRWVVVAMLLLTPLILLKGQSYEHIRDAMVDTPILKNLNTFYYEHTLLAADVIKPAPYRTQNAIALEKDIVLTGDLPHGTLWISTAEPCALTGASLSAGASDLACLSVKLANKSASPETILKDPALDRNNTMRKGIGTFLTKGPILIVPVFLLAWFALGLARLTERNLTLGAFVISAFLLVFVPGFSHLYAGHELRKHPEKIHAYAASKHPSQRYQTLLLQLDSRRRLVEKLTPMEIDALAKDPYAKIRLNALILAGRSTDKAAYFTLVKNALADPQVNVRTKACQALGKIGGPEALELLGQTLNNDPSWYVRDYAYHAIGRIRPISAWVKQ